MQCEVCQMCFSHTHSVISLILWLISDAVRRHVHFSLSNIHTAICTSFYAAWRSNFVPLAHSHMLYYRYPIYASTPNMFVSLNSVCVLCNELYGLCWKAKRRAKPCRFLPYKSVFTHIVQIQCASYLQSAKAWPVDTLSFGGLDNSGIAAHSDARQHAHCNFLFTM